uniref:Immunoglobulin V-set domain-containing protein n=1 Tax=Electrophorus electricus TaxID=8005 RepID=A0A4W4GVR3_ELEEL
SLGTEFQHPRPRCVSGVTVVTQKPPVLTVTKGQKATMDCNLSTVRNSGARSYKQLPGGVPQYVLTYYHSDSSPSYGSGFSSPKFTSTHSSTSDYSLVINNVEVGDSYISHNMATDAHWLDTRGVFTGSAQHSEWKNDKTMTCEVSAGSSLALRKIQMSKCLV